MLGPSLEIGAALPSAPLWFVVSPAIPTLAAAVLPPVLILVLCVVAAIGTLLLLPGRREAALRKIGGAVLLAAALILVALLVRAAAGTGGMGVYFWIFSAVALVGALRVITHPRPVYSALYFVLTVFATAGLFVLLWAEFMAVALVLIYAGAILVTYVFVIMLAAEATPTSGPMAGMAEHDAISREPLMASAVGFALMGVLLFVIFEKADGLTAKPPAASLTYVHQDPYAMSPELASVLAAGNPTTQPVYTAPADNKPASRPSFSSEWQQKVASLTYSNQDPRSRPAMPPTGFVPQGGVQELGAYLFRSQLVNLELAGLILTISMIGAIVIARRRVVGGESVTHAVGGGETVIGPATPIDDDPHSIPVYGTENPRQKAYPET